MKFNVTGQITISITTVVEAETAAEALEIASFREPQGLPAFLGGARHEEWVLGSELDGEPVPICAVEADDVL